MNPIPLTHGLVAIVALGAMIGCDGQASDDASFQAADGAHADTTIVFTSTRQGFDIWALDLDGTPARNLTQSDASEQCPDVSPDGTQIVYVVERPNLLEGGDIWVMRSDGTNQRAITSSAAADGWPKWSPDGTRIAFVSSRASPGGPGGSLSRSELFVMDADGSNVQQLTEFDGEVCHPCWSLDGTRIVFDRNERGGRVMLSIGSDGSDLINLSERLAAVGFDGGAQVAEYSPDGREIVFIRTNRGTEICVMSADGSRWQIVPTGEGHKAHPAWSPDGTAIVFAWGREQGFDLCLVAPDGSALRPVTDSPFNDSTPVWVRRIHPPSS